MSFENGFITAQVELINTCFRQIDLVCDCAGVHTPPPGDVDTAVTPAAEIK